MPKHKLSYDHAATFETPQRVLPEYAKVNDKELNYRRLDSFDRSIMPEVANAVKAHMPKLYHIYFDNGAELLGTQSCETPTVEIDISFPAGERYVEEGKEGLANLTATMMEEGTIKSTKEELQARLDKLGSTVSISAANYTTSISISTLEANLHQTLDMCRKYC